MTELSTLEYDGRVFSFPYADLVPRLTTDELYALHDSVEKHGVLDPVKHTADDAVIDGMNRLLTAKSLNIPLSAIPLKEMSVSADVAEMLAVQLRFARSEPSRERRILVSHRLRRRGWSLRRIAEAIGVSYVSVSKYLEESDPEGGDSGVNKLTPDAPAEAEPGRVVGADGKSYPASQPKNEPAPTVEAEVAVPDERPDVPTEEPTEQDVGGDKEKPLTVQQLKKKFNTAYTVAVRMAQALGKYQKARRQWQEIYDITLGVED